MSLLAKRRRCRPGRDFATECDAGDSERVVEEREGVKSCPGVQMRRLATSLMNTPG